MQAHHDTSPSTLGQRTEHWLVRLMVLAHVALAIGFSLGPIFEGPDEIDHYKFVRYLVQNKALPNPFVEAGAQFHQAPLYYALAAPISLLSDDEGFEHIDGRHNPYYVIDRRQNPQRGEPYSLAGNDNKNLFIHTSAENFPYSESGVARTVHLLRLLSVALGAGTVVASYAIFRILWPTRTDRRLMALGFVAFMPQFLYLSSVINNDGLLFLLATLSLYLELRQMRDGPTWRSAALLGVVLGMALLTKVNANFLIIPIGLATLLDRRMWRYAPLTLAIVLMVAGWWYGRNLVLYGELTGASALFEAAQPEEAIRGGAFVPAVGLANLPFAYQTFWARFGPNLVTVGEPVYIFFDVFSVVVLVGLGIWLIRSLAARTPQSQVSSTRNLIVVGAFVAGWFMFLGYYVSVARNGSQGRYLLTGIAGWGVLVALGLDTWTPRRWRLGATLAGISLLAGVASVTLFGYFLPAYRVSSAPVTIEHELALRYENAAELIGIEPPLTGVQPGETLHITLYWRAIAPTETRLQSYLHSIDGELVRRDSLPGTGNLLSTEWQAGQTWAESYIVTIPGGAETQVAHQLIAGLYDPATDTALPATNEEGQSVLPTVGLLAVNGAAAPFEPDYRFGEVIGLAEPRIIVNGETVKVCLDWVSLAPTSNDYQVFVHLLEADGQVMAQADFAPKDGNYPTSVWTTGETIKDCAMLATSQVPSDDWQVGIGLYQLASGQRLTAQDANGKVLTDNVVRVSP